MTIRNLVVFAAIAALLCACAATPAQITGAAAAGTGALIAFVDSMRNAGVLDPITAANLTDLAGHVQSTVDATSQAFHAIAGEVAAVKANVAGIKSSAGDLGATGITAIATAGTVAVKAAIDAAHKSGKRSASKAA